MLFNSSIFILFLLAVTTLHFLIPKNLRIYLVLISSYFFYGYLFPYHTFLLIAVTICAYWFGKLIYKENKFRKRKVYFIISIVVVLLPLLTFKYLNFIMKNINELFKFATEGNEIQYLNILLPIGISFYTMQAISYLIDIYRNDIKPENDLRTFSAYLSFFPQILAGPIERANKLIPQLSLKENFNLDTFSLGLRRILWGFFKKIVIADKLALIVDPIYNNPNEYSGIILIFGTYLYAFQIYCDFSGYVDIALGIGKIFGINLSENFNKPYNATSIKEFWHRWHITLSFWFRDYLYIPLGGNKAKGVRLIINILLVFAVSGLWHGANYTFIVWGLLHGMYYLFERLGVKIKSSIFINFKPRADSASIRLMKTFVIFNLISFAWIFFKAKDISDSLVIIKKIFDLNLLGFLFNPYLIYEKLIQINFISITEMYLYPLLLIAFLIIENSAILKSYLCEVYSSKINFSHLLLIDFIIITLIFLTETGTQKFIYFQF